MLLSVSETVRDLLASEVPGLSAGAVEIQQLHGDDGANLSQNRLLLVLYHVQPNPHLRNEPPRLADDGYRYGPLYLTLRYLITYISNDADAVQQRLAGVVTAFHRHSRIGPERLAPDLVDQVRDLRVTMRAMSSEELNQLWTALNRGMRLALYYDVDVAPVEGGVPAGPTISRREVRYVEPVR